MSKMREALDALPIERFPKNSENFRAGFDAGYQAAIADVKAGGIALEVVNEWVDHGDYDQGNELICKPLKKLALGDRLYKLLEDE